MLTRSDSKAGQGKVDPDIRQIPVTLDPDLIGAPGVLLIDSQDRLEQFLVVSRAPAITDQAVGFMDIRRVAIDISDGSVHLPVSGVRRSDSVLISHGFLACQMGPGRIRYGHEVQDAA